MDDSSLKYLKNAKKVIISNCRNITDDGLKYLQNA